VEGVRTDPIVFQAVRDAPAATIHLSAVDTSHPGLVRIDYDAKGHTPDAQVSLYYSPNPSGDDGIPIADGLVASDGQHYVWDTTFVPSGLYYIHAVVSDGGDIPRMAGSPDGMPIDIDFQPPGSGVYPLPMEVDSTFIVNWFGQDDPGGSGINYFDVYVSVDGSPFEIWLVQVSESSASFVGEAGRSYEFVSIATDHAGNRESKEMVAEATTRVIGDIKNALVLNDLSTGTYWGHSMVIDLLLQVGSSQSAIDPASVVIETDAQHGSVTMLGDGRVRYDADTGFVGEDEIALTVRDVDGRVSNLGTVTIRVVNSPLQNPMLALDVNGDNEITALDALLVINTLSLANGSISLDDSFQGPPYFDTNGDRAVTALDALLVINHLARSGASGAGEAEGVADELNHWLADVENRLDGIMMLPREDFDSAVKRIMDPESLGSITESLLAPRWWPRDVFGDLKLSRVKIVRTGMTRNAAETSTDASLRRLELLDAAWAEFDDGFVEHGERTWNR